jgi:hypothetical protein
VLTVKYFTPVLYVRGNSTDDDQVDVAETEWETARAAYRARVAEIGPALLPELRRFEAELNLHDAEVIGPAREGNRDVLLIARLSNTPLPGQDNSLAILRYRVIGPPSVTTPVRSRVFDSARPEWLYDEIDFEAPGVFSHEVLFSDGRVVRLVFDDFSFAVDPLLPTPDTAAAANSAQKVGR